MVPTACSKSCAAASQALHMILPLEMLLSRSCVQNCVRLDVSNSSAAVSISILYSITYIFRSSPDLGVDRPLVKSCCVANSEIKHVAGSVHRQISRSCRRLMSQDDAESCQLYAQLQQPMAELGPGPRDRVGIELHTSAKSVCLPVCLSKSSTPWIKLLSC